MEYFVTGIAQIIVPGKTRRFFKLKLDYDHFKVNEIISFNKGYNNLLIITKPKRKWYKLALQYITFAIYKAPWEYKVENNDTTTKRSTCTV